MENNYPQTRAAKIALIKRMLSGELTIEDVRNQGYEVTMWRQDSRDLDYLENFEPSFCQYPEVVHGRISKAEFATRPGIHVTLNIG